MNEAGASAAAGMQREAGRLASSDGLDLYWRAWTPAAARAVIVIVHGLAEHGGRYEETASSLAEWGCAVFAGDLRAHGLSGDIPGAGRVHVRRFEDYFLDVDAVVGLARQRHPGLPLFLLGHSMGGLITLRYVLDRPADLAGAVISSPALGTHPDFKPPLALRLLVGLLSVIAPRARFPSDLDTTAISRDPAVVKAYIEDPLVSQKVSARWYAEILRSMKRAHADAARLTLPVLLMQSGADRLVDPAAPGRWAADAPAGLVELVTWDGFFHEMFNEPEKHRVMDHTLAWLQARLRPLATGDAPCPA